MSEPCTAEVLPVWVRVGAKVFTWTAEAGLDPESVLELEGWIKRQAFRLRFPAAKAGHSLDDLIQEGRIGALEAARRFDPYHAYEDGTHSHCQFVGFASYAIRDRMLDLIRYGDLTLPIRGLPEGESWPCIASIDAGPIGDRSGSLKDCLAAPVDAGLDPAVDLGREKLLNALADLGPQDREVLVRRFLDGDGESFQDIAEAWGITRQRVQQIEKRAQMRLRSALARRGMTKW